MDHVEAIAIARLKKELTRFARSRVPNDGPRGKGTSLLLWKIGKWGEEQSLRVRQNVSLNEIAPLSKANAAKDGTFACVLAGLDGYSD